MIQPLEILERETLRHLITESLQEGHRFIERMLNEHENGLTTFTQPGEILLAARENGHIKGICGLTKDPYLKQPQIGRVRHLYVEQQSRGKGISRLLLHAILMEAKQHYQQVTLYTDNPIAARLYESAGFLPCTHLLKATHCQQIKR